MDLKDFKKAMRNFEMTKKIQAAKASLDRHKQLGARSSLSILQVAELLDIVSGKQIATVESNPMFINETFSLN